MASDKTAAPWWNDAVFYQILIDRFRRAGFDTLRGDPMKPDFCGGNLRGVIEALPYLQKLGIDALWLSPIQPTAAYHGYHITNFEGVEQRFGGMASFKALMNAAKPDFRIIMDFVPNHVHRSHPIFLDAQKRKNSHFRDWFFFDDQGGYLCFLDFGELPKLNLDNPETRRYVIDCALQWLELGIDGFRLDHVLGPSMSFWHAFHREVKARFPSAYLLGEALFLGVGGKHMKTLGLPHKRTHLKKEMRGESVIDDIMLEYRDVMDGVLDFGFREIMVNEIAHAKHLPSKHHVQSLLDKHYAKFPEGFSLPSFLDNHDINRFLFEAKDRINRLKLTSEIQFKQKQPPILYYGTEAGMSQTRDIWCSHGDLHARQPIPWNNPNPKLLEFYTDLIRRRKSRNR
ncbi:MAG: hypothetical protein JXR25_14865 [Pontiellaceae bacterium]|nr:hypothetical protein [Pontiellaceae bacterium]